MRNGFVTAVLGAIAAWWIIEKIKAASATDTATPASLSTADEAQSETFV